MDASARSECLSIRAAAHRRRPKEKAPVRLRTPALSGSESDADQ
jgi:hypothetical protein